MASVLYNDQDAVDEFRQAAEAARNYQVTKPSAGQASFNTNIAEDYTNEIKDINNQIADKYDLLAYRTQQNLGLGFLDSRRVDDITPAMDINKLQSQLKGVQLRGNELSSQTTQQDQALASAGLNTQAEANANKTANINTGINKSKAGMLGAQSASTDTANTANNLYTANSSNAAATQADYLSKMNAASQLDAEAEGADATARNMNKSALLAGASGALQGAGSGAMMGAVISDENMKEPVSDEEMNAAYKEFVELYFRLKELKGEK